MKSIVLKEWMRIGLSICLLGLPVILGYFSIQIVEASNTEIAKDSPAPALENEFEISTTSGVVGGKTRSRQLPEANSGREAPLAATTPLQANAASGMSGGARYPLDSQHKKTAAEPQAPTLYADYGDLFTTGQLVIASANTYISELFRGFTLHKTGRLVDPASYIHSTIR